ALSTKVLEYMAAARPVVASVSGWTAEVISRAGAGIVCPPEDAQALADGIAELTADPARAREMGASGRRFVEARLTRARVVEVRRGDLLERLALGVDHAHVLGPGETEVGVAGLANAVHRAAEDRDLDRVVVCLETALDLAHDRVHVELKAPAGRARDQDRAA